MVRRKLGVPRVATATDARHAEIIKMHTDICALCNTVPGGQKHGREGQRFQGFGVQIVVVLYPSEIPISDDLASSAINVVARLTEKSKNALSRQFQIHSQRILRLPEVAHAVFFQHLRADRRIVSAEFDTIFDGATRQVATITKGRRKASVWQSHNRDRPNPVASWECRSR